jgi:signal transduction histidine kinase/CheY-like chemotaxis protein
MERHRLLQRQVRKYLLDAGVDISVLAPFLNAVDQSYKHYDSAREFVDHAMRVSSDELEEKTIKLNEKNEQQAKLIESLREALNKIGNAEVSDDDDVIHIAELLGQAITERKKVEADLISARAQAETALETRKIFLANISHEIRTPINAINGIAGLVQEGELTPQQREYVRALITATKTLMAIVGDMLDMSKLESGRFSLENISFNSHDLFEALELAMSWSAEQKGLKLRFEIDPNIPEVLIGDPTRLSQIINNLLSNAVKFTEEGEVVCIIRKTFNCGDLQRIEFIVRDTGIGIDKSKILSVFEQFVQEDESITRKYGGTGLGLSISKTLIEMMGGELEVESTKGEGSEFRFDVLFKIGTPEEIIAKTEKTEGDLRGMRILLVENNELNQLLVLSQLKLWNARVLTAANGQEAIDLLKHEKVDLVLMDLQMPVMDGFQASQYIRESMNLSMPIIALTANFTESERLSTFEAGMDAFISKPYSAEFLFDSIMQLHSLRNTLPKDGKYPYSLEKIEQLSRGDRSKLESTVRIFKEQICQAVPKLLEASWNGDFDRVRKTLHDIGPGLEWFGMVDVGKKMKTIRQAAVDLNAEAMKPEVVSLCMMLRMVCNSLNAEFAVPA